MPSSVKRLGWWGLGLALGFCLGLMACDRSTPPPPPPLAAVAVAPMPLDKAQALSMVFGLPQPKTGLTLWKGITLLPAQQSLSEYEAWDQADGAVEALALKPTQDGRLLLVTGTSALAADGQADECHGCGALISAFYFSPVDGVWRLSGQVNALGVAGSNGRAGGAQILPLGTGRTGFVVLSGGTWQGQTIGVMDIYEAVGNQVLPRTRESIRIFADNGGFCHDEVACFEVSGKWMVEPTTGDLAIQFSGNNPEESPRPLRERAVYRLQGDHYVLVEGRNPVPEI